VLFEIEAIDRRYLNLSQPEVCSTARMATPFVGRWGNRFASALMAPMTAALTADIHHFITARGLELVHLTKGSTRATSLASTGG
jgi:hypothetical protein